MALINPTKQRILRKSVELFAQQGYDGVPVKQIAQEAGIQPASIYNHYRSKDAILQDIYTYYVKNAFLARLPLEACLPILKSGTAQDIVDIFNYPFADPKPGWPIMFDVVRIIWSRIYIDAKASEIYRVYVLDAGYTYICEVLLHGIEIGRIQNPKEEVEPLASALLAARTFTAGAVVSDPDHDKWRKVESGMLAMMARSLVLGPPL